MYLPDGEHQFNASIPTPEQVLGYQIGTYFLNWGDICKYMERLDAASDRVFLKRFGRTYNHRDFIQICVSSEENISNLEKLERSICNSVIRLAPQRLKRLKCRLL